MQQVNDDYHQKEEEEIANLLMIYKYYNKKGLQTLVLQSPQFLHSTCRHLQEIR